MIVPSSFTKIHLPPCPIATTAACLLCLALVACQPQESITPGSYLLASFYGSFTPAGDLNPPVPKQAFGSNTTYWIKAGEQVRVGWDTYNLNLQCKDNGDAVSQSYFAFNLCSTVSGCQGVTGVRGASCVLGNGGSQGVVPYSPPSECTHWPPQHDIFLVNSPSNAVAVAANAQSATGYHVGPNGPNAWLVSRPCPNGVCSSDLSPSDPQIKKQHFLWAEGCSPTTIPPIDPGVSGNGNDDVSLQLLASDSIDPVVAPFPDDQPSRTPDGTQSTPLTVIGVGSFPRIYNRFVKFARFCDPIADNTSNPCNASDTAEAQYTCSTSPADNTPANNVGCVNQSSSAGVAHEYFSSRVRVKEIRVYSDQSELPFCFAFLKGEPRSGSSQTTSNCDASVEQTDCAASPAMGLNRTPAHDWKITFSKGSPKCPDDATRSAVWVRFTLEAP